MSMVLGGCDGFWLCVHWKRSLKNTAPDQQCARYYDGVSGFPFPPSHFLG